MSRLSVKNNFILNNLILFNENEMNTEAVKKNKNIYTCCFLLTIYIYFFLLKYTLPIPCITMETTFTPPPPSTKL